MKIIAGRGSTGSRNKRVSLTSQKFTILKISENGVLKDLER